MDLVKIDLIAPEHIAEMVKCMTPIADMAAMLAVDEYDLRERLTDPNDNLCKYYQAKVAELKMEIRKRDIELAESCSPTAIERVHNYLKIMEEDL